LTVREKISSHKNMQCNYNKKMFVRRARPLRITSVRIRGVLMNDRAKEERYILHTIKGKLNGSVTSYVQTAF
jgi:hypothetical protein